MIYFSQILGMPVIDAKGEQIGTVDDLGIDTEEVFPKITSLTIRGDQEEPMMLSWRKYVQALTDDEIKLNADACDLRFSYLQPEEVLIGRDLMHKQIVDTRGIKVVRVDDLKLSNAGATQLRLVGATASNIDKMGKMSSSLFSKQDKEQVIAWNYIDLLDRNLNDVTLSVSHKTLDGLHPADIADIIEQLEPEVQARVVSQLDNNCAAEAMAELDEDNAAEIVDVMNEEDASGLLNEMDPDDAADLVGELDYDKAEQLLHKMGVAEQQEVRKLLGYKQKTAGRIMTSEFVSVRTGSIVQDAIDKIRTLDSDFETINYVYIVDENEHLEGVISIRALIVSTADTKLEDIAQKDLIYANPEEDQEDVALSMSKYNLLAMPIVDESMRILGIVTADDALDIMEEEHEEDLHIAGAHDTPEPGKNIGILKNIASQEIWLVFWVLGILITTEIFRLVPGTVDPYVGLIASFALPICLHAATSAVKHATAYYFDNEPEDEDAQTLSNFAWSEIGAAALFSFLAWVILAGCSNLIEAGFDLAEQETLFQFGFGIIWPAFLYGVNASLISLTVSYAIAPAYVHILRSRDEAAMETSGVKLRELGFVIAIVAFILALTLIWTIAPLA